MKYEVTFKGSVTLEANSLREANQIVQDNNPEWETLYFFELDDESNVEHEVIGHCEVSGLSIFEEDEFVSDADGIMILKEFFEIGN